MKVTRPKLDDLSADAIVMTSSNVYVLSNARTVRTTNLRQIALALIGMLWALSACSQHKPVPPPDVKLNPAPKQRYEITVTILDDPGPVNRVNGRVQFNIRNLDCVPMDYSTAIGGRRPKVDKFSDVVFNRRGSNKYIGYVYSDLYLSENYYDLGICEWAMTAVNGNVRILETVQTISIKSNYVLKEMEAINICRRPSFSNKLTMNLCSRHSTVLKEDVSEPKNLNYRVSVQSRRI